MPEPARIITAQRLEWSDTDASGHHHYGAMFRMAAVAESELLESLGLLDELSGGLPRVHMTLDLHAPVTFRARVNVELGVSELGTTSIAFEFTITADAGIVAEGRVVAVRVGDDGRPLAWTPLQRRILTESGTVPATERGGADPR